MANKGFEKLKKALGDGFQVPEPEMRMDEMDLSHPEDVVQTRPLAKGSNFRVPAEMRFPPMDPTEPDRVMEMPEMDLRPNVVDSGSVDVPDEALQKLATPDIPTTETLVARPGFFGKGELISPDDPTAAAPEPSLTAMDVHTGGPGRMHIGPSRDRSSAKALIAKARPPSSKDPLDISGVKPTPDLNPGLSEADINTTGPSEGPKLADAFPAAAPEDSPGFAAVRRPLTPRPGSVPAQVGQAVTGAAPSPGTVDRPMSDLERAQQAAKRAEREAQYARGMGQAADIISGTHYNDRAGEDIRAAGQQGVEDVLQREQQGLRAAGEARATEDQTFQRQGEQRAQGADQRAKTAFDTAQGEFDPNHPRSKGARNALVAQYPKVAARIPPDQFATMSEHDIKMLMGELPDKPVKGGGTGAKPISPTAIATWSNRIPKSTRVVDQLGQQIDQQVANIGGWDKVVAGYLEGNVPRAALDDVQKNIQQMVSAIDAEFKFGHGGKNLTDGEQKILNDIASSIKGGKTVAEIQNGLRLMRQISEDNYAQALVGAPDELVNQFRSDMSGNRTALHPNGTPAPKAAASAAQPPVKTGKDGKSYRVFPDGSAELVE